MIVFKFNKNEEEIKKILKVISRKGVDRILKSLRNNPKNFPNYVRSEESS